MATKTKRSDKKKNIDKITASLVKNPLQSQREVAKDVWCSNWTAHNIKTEIEQSWAKDDRIINLTDWDFLMMRAIQDKKFWRLLDKEDPVDDTNLNNWDREAKARYTLFRWEGTDELWGQKDVTPVINIIWDTSNWNIKE